MNKLTSLVDETFEQQVESLKELIAVPSVSRGEPQPGMPLGKGVHDALTQTLELAKKLGFPQARSLDGYCGVVDYGEGDEMLMLMAHLDVVPAGPAWDSDPFCAEIREGRIYGRGVVDDKGAAISMLYALQAVKDAGIPLKRRVRLFFGCDEEKDWACIERYKKTEPEPDLAFTPDADYPLVNSEKSILQVCYERAMQNSGVRVNCGIAANVVPGEAEATLDHPAKPVRSSRLVVPQIEGNTIRVFGHGGHASRPDLAQNAMLYLLETLAQQELSPEDTAVATGLAALLGHDQHGEGFGIDCEDASGRLTLSPDKLSWDENNVRLTMDCRYPFCTNAAALEEKFDAALGALGFTRVYTKDSKGHYIPADSELVQTLLKIYERNVGHAAKPLSIGGGTYARSFQNAVGFGIEPEGEISQCHMPNESLSLDALRFNTRVIAEAIAELAGQQSNNE